MLRIAAVLGLRLNSSDEGVFGVSRYLVLFRRARRPSLGCVVLWSAFRRYLTRLLPLYTPGFSVLMGCKEQKERGGKTSTY